MHVCLLLLLFLKSHAGLPSAHVPRGHLTGHDGANHKVGGFTKMF